MTLEIKPDGVAEAPKTIKPLRIPEGVDPTSFRSVLAAYTTAYRMHGRHPSVSEVRAYWPRLSEQAVGEMLVSPEFRDALAGRGIALGDTPGLSHQQHLVLMALSDPYDKRNLKQKLETVGVTTQQYANWQRNGVFQAARRALVGRVFEDSIEDIKTTMVQQAIGGSFQQQQFVMETLGEGPKAREQASAQQIVQHFLSAIARATNGHPEIRQAIMDEMKVEMTMVQMTQESIGQ